MLHLDHPVLLEVSADERDKALDCLVLDNDEGTEIRVCDEDAAVLDALAAMLDRA